MRDMSGYWMMNKKRVVKDRGGNQTLARFKVCTVTNYGKILCL